MKFFINSVHPLAAERFSPIDPKPCDEAGDLRCAICCWMVSVCQRNRAAPPIDLRLTIPGYNCVMRNALLLLILLLSLSLACQAVIPATPGAVWPSATVTPRPSLTATITASPSATVTPVEPTPTEVCVPPSSTAPPAGTAVTPEFEVRMHPDGGLYAGDRISFEVIAPSNADLEENQLSLFDHLQDDPLSVVGFSPFGIGGRYQATLPWVWDTAGLGAGNHVLTIAIQPLGLTWTHTITLNSAAQLPLPEPGASWAVEESSCCLVYYITNTAADRDLESLLESADRQADDTVDRLGIEFSEPIVVTLMPRVLGHGGFASDEIYISYLDRNYAGNNVGMVLHHEMVHILDSRLGGDLRPSLLVEGLAVYLAGGHYKPEPLRPRAATLLSAQMRSEGLGLGWYIPLAQLADDFYKSQHEIGYLQAGALIEFMVDTWGWEAFSTFYRNIHPVESGSHAQAMDTALQAHLGLSLADLNSDFTAALQAEPVSQVDVDNVRLTVAYFNTLRRYQQILDPSAYFLTAWLPDGPQMREAGIVADVVRHPAQSTNVALETLLVAAHENLLQEDFTGLAQKLDAANAVLAMLESGAENPFSAAPLAWNYYQVVEALMRRGYRVEKLSFRDEIAQAEVSDGWANLWQIELVQSDTGWRLLGE